jgi:hypothetical protein
MKLRIVNRVLRFFGLVLVIPIHHFKHPFTGAIFIGDIELRLGLSKNHPPTGMIKIYDGPPKQDREEKEKKDD